VSQEPSLFNLPADEIAKIKEMSASVSENSLDQIFRMLQKGIGDLLRAQNPAILLDVLLLRLCHYKDLQSLDEILKRLDSVESQSVSSVPPPKEPKKVEAPPGGWGDFLKDLQQKKPQLASVLDHSSSVEIGQKSVALFFPSRSIHLEILRDRERVIQLEERLAQFFGRPLTVSLQERGEKEKSLVDEAVAIFQPASLKTIS
jgi:DNA polymerase III gamma/tau subunit